MAPKSFTSLFMIRQRPSAAFPDLRRPLPTAGGMEISTLQRHPEMSIESSMDPESEENSAGIS
jgi:hypothetical protein